MAAVKNKNGLYYYVHSKRGALCQNNNSELKRQSLFSKQGESETLSRHPLRLLEPP